MLVCLNNDQFMSGNDYGSKSDTLKSIENQTSWTWIILPVKIRYTQSVIIKIHVCDKILARGQKRKGKATAKILICILINMFMRSNIMYNLFWCIVPVIYKVELILIQYFFGEGTQLYIKQFKGKVS